MEFIAESAMCRPAFVDNHSYFKEVIYSLLAQCPGMS